MAALVLLELGLRGLGLFVAMDAGHPGERDPGEHAILCLGDSWTHGLHTASYGQILEEKLNAASDDGRVYRVVRSGIPGSNSSQGLGRLARHLAEERFDTVIVLLGNNDHQNLAGSEYWRFADEPGLFRGAAGRARVALHSLRLYKLLRTMQLRVSGRPTLDAYFARGTEASRSVPKETVIPFGPHRRQLEHNLGEIVELVRLHGATPVFMTYFYFHGYEVNESILDVASAYGVPVVNNTVLFHERIPAAHREEFYAGAHPTARGYAFIADNILETVTFD